MYKYKNLVILRQRL